MNKNEFKQLILETIGEVMNEVKPDTLRKRAEQLKERLSEVFGADTPVVKLSQVTKAGIGLANKESTLKVATAVAKSRGYEMLESLRVYVNEDVYEAIENALGSDARVDDITKIVNLYFSEVLGDTQAKVNRIFAEFGVKPVAGKSDIPANELPVLEPDSEDELGLSNYNPDDPEASEPDEIGVGEDLYENRLKKQKINEVLNRLIKESIEEIKDEEEASTSKSMDEVLKIVQKSFPDAKIALNNAKNFVITGCDPHFFDIRPEWVTPVEKFDVIYWRDRSAKRKWAGLSFEELKKFIKEKIESKEEGYTETAYNKASKNSVDVTKPSSNPRHDIVTKKEVKDTKKEDKDYNEPFEKDATKYPAPGYLEKFAPSGSMIPTEEGKEKPYSYKEVKEIKKQVDHPIGGTKPKYTNPEKEKTDKRHVVKPAGLGKKKISKNIKSK